MLRVSPRWLFWINFGAKDSRVAKNVPSDFNLKRQVAHIAAMVFWVKINILQLFKLEFGFKFLVIFDFMYIFILKIPVRLMYVEYEPCEIYDDQYRNLICVVKWL